MYETVEPKFKNSSCSLFLLKIEIQLLENIPSTYYTVHIIQCMLCKQHTLMERADGSIWIYHFKQSS